MCGESGLVPFIFFFSIRGRGATEGGGGQVKFHPTKQSEKRFSHAEGGRAQKVLREF